MQRFIDAKCKECGLEAEDIFVTGPVDSIVHATSDGFHVMEEIWWARRKQVTQWDEKEAVVVFRRPDGSYSFPARNDKPTPQGCERIVARSDREVARLERDTKTLSESRWFDRGSGRGFDDRSRSGPSEAERFKRFQEAMR